MAKTSLLLLGLGLIALGGLVSWWSVNSASYNSLSGLPSASIELLVGAFVVIAGVLLLFMGYLSTSRRHLYPYY